MSEIKKTATRESYGNTLAELGAEHEDIVVLDADLAGATKTSVFKKAFPDRFFDCGIAESNMIAAAAGMAAHLAGVIAAGTTLPVIGIPCKSSVLDGMDALLSTVMMPPGIPVATVAIDGGANAALLAAEILALGDEELAARLQAKRKADADKVLDKDAAIMERL